MTAAKLTAANPGPKVFEAGDEAFLDYGRPLDILGAAELDGLVAVTDLASRAPQNWYARQAAQPPAAGKPTVQG